MYSSTSGGIPEALPSCGAWLDGGKAEMQGILWRENINVGRKSVEKVLECGVMPLNRK
jgi:hypothetical protein